MQTRTQVYMNEIASEQVSECMSVCVNERVTSQVTATTGKLFKIEKLTHILVKRFLLPYMMS